MTDISRWAETLVYNPYHTMVPEMVLEGYDECSVLVKWIIENFSSHRKVLGNRSIAFEMVRRSLKNPDQLTLDDIDWAWAVGAGGGMEFEWLEEAE